MRDEMRKGSAVQDTIGVELQVIATRPQIRVLLGENLYQVFEKCSKDVFLRCFR